MKKETKNRRKKKTKNGEKLSRRFEDDVSTTSQLVSQFRRGPPAIAPPRTERCFTNSKRYFSCYSTGSFIPSGSPLFS